MSICHTYLSLDAAERAMRLRNRSRGLNAELTVLVDGPGDGEYTIMGVRQAIENDFAYRWSC